MPRLFPFAHPRHRQHQAISPPRRPHLMEIGAGHSRSSKPFPTAGKQKGLGLGAWETNRNRFPKKSEAQPIGACHYAVQHSLSMPLGSTSMSSDSSLKKSRCKMREMFATTSVSKLLFATQSVYHRPASSQLLGQPAHRPSLSVELFSDELSYVYHVGLRY